MRWFSSLCLLVFLMGCNMTDRGIAKLQVVEDLTLGQNMEDVKQQWFLYSAKALQVDPALSSDRLIACRGVSRDPSVTAFFLYFNSKTKILEQAEWRYHSSMTESKEKELQEYWTKKLWPPSYQQRWDGKVYVWADRKARLELYLADGICHLIHRLN